MERKYNFVAMGFKHEMLKQRVADINLTELFAFRETPQGTSFWWDIWGEYDYRSPNSFRCIFMIKELEAHWKAYGKQQLREHMREMKRKQQMKTHKLKKERNAREYTRRKGKTKSR